MLQDGELRGELFLLPLLFIYTHFTIGRFLRGSITLGFPLSCTDLFLYRITLPAVSCDAPPTLSYTTLELASRVLLSSKKPALCHMEIFIIGLFYCTIAGNLL
jgi:hypothetical protein